jgi:hypothetical protein
MNSRYKAMVRRRLLEDIYSRMSEEERRALVMTAKDDKRHEEIMAALAEQRNATDDVLRKIGRYPFATDLAANVTGNFITRGLVWIGNELIKRL